jgi:hypothetical protein
MIDYVYTNLGGTGGYHVWSQGHNEQNSKRLNPAWEKMIQSRGKKEMCRAAAGVRHILPSDNL